MNGLCGATHLLPLRFWDATVLGVARRLPWSLCAGNLDQNVVRLAQMPSEGLECTVAQLQRLLQCGGATHYEVRATLFLMSQTPWTTMDVEQAHGSLAVCHRFHPDLSASHLAMRSYLHMSRACFAPTKQEIALAKLQRQLEQLGRQNPNKIRGTSLFVAQVSAIVQSALGPNETQPLVWWQRQMHEHARRWKELDPGDQLRFKVAADHLRQDRWRQIGDEQDHLSSAIAIMRKRTKQEEAHQPRNLLRANRCDTRELEILGCILASTAESHQSADQYMRHLSAAPLRLSDGLMKCLAEFPHQAVSRRRDGPIPEWARLVAANRHQFGSTCLAQIDADTGLVAQCFMFVLALQNPVYSIWQRVSHCRDLNHAYDCHGIDRPLGAHNTDGRMCCLPQAWVLDMDMQVDTESEHWYVIPHVERMEGSWLGSVDAMLPWSTFVHHLDNPVAQGAGEGARRPPGAGAGDVPAWVREWLGDSEPRSQHTRPPVPARDAQPAAEPAALSEEQAAIVAHELAEMRLWVRELVPSHCEAFSVRVLGGQWTARHVRKSWDAIQGFARTTMAELMCLHFGLQQTFRCGRADFSREHALEITIHFAEKMSHFFNIWRDEGFGEYHFTQHDVDSFDQSEFQRGLAMHSPASDYHIRGTQVLHLRPGPWRKLRRG